MYVQRDNAGNIIGAYAALQPEYAEEFLAITDPALIAFLAVKAPTVSMRLVSISTPVLDGTYPLDPATQQKVQAISLYVAVNAKFPAGQTTQAWPDVTGAMHQFQTTTQWQAFATAMGDFVAAIDLGQTPTQPVTIP